MTTLDVSHCYRFGRFVLEPERRSLLAGSAPVPLGGRAFDILLLLVRHHDRVVTKDEILSKVWRGTIVEENNLAVHISALRRALGEKPGGDRFIATVSGLGYRFVASVVEAALGLEETASAPLVVTAPPALPAASVPPGRARLSRATLLTIAALLALTAALVVARAPSPALDAPRLSIAVLPFRDLKGGPQTYVADAVTDDLTTDLSHIAGSVVIARESAGAFRDHVDDAAIGRALKVRYLLEGSVLGEGSRLHVNARLIDAAAGTQLWANVFDVGGPALADSLAEIVERVSSALRFTLVQAEETRSQQRPAADPDAFDLTLRAKSILDRSNDFPALVSAQQYLERAVAIASADSDALAELGLVLVHKMGDFEDVDEEADRGRAVSVIAKALSIAPRNPLAITAKGMLGWLDYRCEEAPPSFRMVLSLDTNNIQARNGLALCARELGNMDEMISQFRDLLRVDPLGSSVPQIENSIGMGYLLTGRATEAVTWLDRAGANLSEAEDGDSSGWGWQDWRKIFLIAAHELAGDKGEAAREYRVFSRSRPHRTVFQLAHYVSRPISGLRGNANYLQALRAAGMPFYAGEDEDFEVPPTDKPRVGGDFDPTPSSIPGGVLIRTGALQALMSTTPRPVVIDISDGATVIPGAVWVSPDDPQDVVRVIEDGDGRISPVGTVVVMGYGPFGWQSYDLALSLIEHGYRHVFWYRGGEAAWTAAGFATEDRRS